MPDPPARHEHCGPPGQPLLGCGCPVAPLWALWHAGTGLVGPRWAAPRRTQERSAVVGRHPGVHPGDVLVAARGLCASAHLALLAPAGVHAVFRIPQKHSVDCTPGRPHGEPSTRGKGHKGQPRSGWRHQLGKPDQLVHGLNPRTGPPWRDQEQWRPRPDGVEVSALQDRGHRTGFRVTRIPVVTTLLDATLDSVDAFAQLSGARWGMATHVAHLQTTMGLDVLQGKTVDGLRKERIVFALLSNVVRLVLAQAAQRHQVAMDRSRLIDAARWLAAARDEEALPWLVMKPYRPFRYEPRVRKRRPTQYPLMQKPRNELRKVLAHNTDMD